MLGKRLWTNTIITALDYESILSLEETVLVSSSTLKCFEELSTSILGRDRKWES